MPSYNEQTGPNNAKMQDYNSMKKELKELLGKKKALEKNLNTLEEQIFKYEGAYLEETQNGNVVKGFDNYIKGGSNKRRAVVNDKDRIFSMSSATFMKAKLKEEQGL